MGVALIDAAYLDRLLKALDPIKVADAPLQLERLRKALEHDQIEPFPISEIPDYLRDWRVGEDEIEHVKSVKVRAPRKRKTKSFFDAYRTLEKMLGVSLIHEVSLEKDPDAIPVIEGWAKGFKKMKPKAKALFKQLVKKVKLRAPHGTEDASWLLGGVMALTVKKYPPLPESAARSITHELGHAFEEAHSVQHWAAPWGMPPYVTEYAEFQPHSEDFAESFRVFIEHPSELRKVAPEKFEALKKLL